MALVLQSTGLEVHRNVLLRPLPDSKEARLDTLSVEKALTIRHACLSLPSAWPS